MQDDWNGEAAVQEVRQWPGPAGGGGAVPAHSGLRRIRIFNLALQSLKQLGLRGRGRRRTLRYHF